MPTGNLIVYGITWLMFFALFCLMTQFLLLRITRSHTNQKSDQSVQFEFVINDYEQDNNSLALELFRDLINENEDLRNLNLTDRYIWNYLHTKDFDPNSSYDLIATYFKLRNEQPRLFKNASTMSKLVKTPVYFYPLQNGSRGESLIYCRMANWDTSKESFLDAMLYAIPFTEHMILEGRALNPPTTIMDMTDLSWSHIWAMRIDDMKLLSELTERALPIKAGIVHIVNQSWIVDAFYKMASPFIGENVQKLFRRHGSDLTKVHEEIGKENLPEAIGGTQPLRKFSEDELKEIDRKLAIYRNSYQFA